ncbi:MAG TPA: ribosome-associated translation inhibitor RaiA [Candidatus Methylomirabilis sp.]|nr:ribosome-associated translation inhibitor RaiA [Candidatus Methylomirabilis sp.]
MKITVSGHQVEITEPLRSYASEKIGRIQKHFDHVTNTNVVLHVQKNQHRAEATIHARGATLHADAQGADMYAAIDLLADKLDRQVLKHKEKRSSHHRGEGSIKKLDAE